MKQLLASKSYWWIEWNRSTFHPTHSIALLSQHSTLPQLRYTRSCFGRMKDSVVWKDCIPNTSRNGLQWRHRRYCLLTACMAFISRAGESTNLTVAQPGWIWAFKLTVWSTGAQVCQVVNVVVIVPDVDPLFRTYKLVGICTLDELDHAEQSVLINSRVCV